eukprot:128573_1
MSIRTIILVFLICYIQDSCCRPFLYIGKARPDLENAQETNNIQQLKDELKDAPRVIDKFKEKESWQGRNNIWKLSDAQVLSTTGYTMSTVASKIRENFWKGTDDNNYPLTVAALKNAVCNNDFAKGLIAGKPPAYEMDITGKVYKRTYDEILQEYKGKNNIFNKGIYPEFYMPSEAEMELKFYFGMQQTCQNQYVGDPTKKIYGPTSVTTDVETARDIFAGGGYGTVFEVTLYRDKPNDIGGIIDARWLSLLPYEDEWVIYDLGLKHLKIVNTDVITLAADQKNPCFYSGTHKEYVEEQKAKKAALWQQKRQQTQKKEREKQNKLKKKLKTNKKQGGGVDDHKNKKKKDKGGGGNGGFSIGDLNPFKYFSFPLSKAEQVDLGDLVDDDGYMESRGETVGELERMIEEELEVFEEEDYFRQILNEIKRRKMKRKR